MEPTITSIRPEYSEMPLDHKIARDEDTWSIITDEFLSEPDDDDDPKEEPYETYELKTEEVDLDEDCKPFSDIADTGITSNDCFVDDQQDWSPFETSAIDQNQCTTFKCQRTQCNDWSRDQLSLAVRTNQSQAVTSPYLALVNNQDPVPSVHYYWNESSNKVYFCNLCVYKTTDLQKVRTHLKVVHSHKDPRNPTNQSTHGVQVKQAASSVRFNKQVRKPKSARSQANKVTREDRGEDVIVLSDSDTENEQNEPEKLTENSYINSYLNFVKTIKSKSTLTKSRISNLPVTLKYSCSDCRYQTNFEPKFDAHKKRCKPNNGYPQYHLSFEDDKDKLGYFYCKYCKHLGPTGFTIIGNIRVDCCFGCSRKINTWN